MLPKFHSPLVNLSREMIAASPTLDEQLVDSLNEMYERHRKLEQSEVDLQNLLSSLGLAPIVASVTVNAPIISIGCGNGREALALRDSHRQVSSAKDFSFIGIDTDSVRLQRAHDLFTSIGQDGTIQLVAGVTFLLGDATNNEVLAKYDSSAPLVLLRHQNISENPPLWTKLFNRALQLVSTNGVVIMTSFSAGEHEMACRTLRENGINILQTLRNPHFRLLKNVGGGDREMSADGHITIFSRTASQK